MLPQVLGRKHAVLGRNRLVSRVILRGERIDEVPHLIPGMVHGHESVVAAALTPDRIQADATLPPGRGQFHHLRRRFLVGAR
jgi:hypothetical protein